MGLDGYGAAMNLAELLSSRREGRSYEELEKDCDGQPSAERLKRLATEPLREFPDPDGIRNLARGLRVSELDVVLAAAESLGLEVPRSLPAILDVLSVEPRGLNDRQALAITQLVRAFRDDADDVDEPTVQGAAVVPGPTPESAQAMRNVESLHGADVQQPPEEETLPIADRDDSHGSSTQEQD